MKKIKILLIVILVIVGLSQVIKFIKNRTFVGTNYTMLSYNNTLASDLGEIKYRVYYPKDFEEETYVIHVSRGGNGLGDDLGGLLPYVRHFVQNGYVVVQIDHRFSGREIENITSFRGEEIKLISSAVSNGLIDYGEFKGSIDRDNQGFLGHSAGSLEGLLAAGLNVTQGDYFVPDIKAVYAMSPAGNNPDQYGISSEGYSSITKTAVFIILGEKEKDINGVGKFMAVDWRLQPFNGLNSNGISFQAFVKGEETKHIDISQGNKEIMQYNLDNATALFDVILKGEDRLGEVGSLSLPQNVEIEFSRK